MPNTQMPNCSVLVVDDDPVMAATICEVLEEEGFATTTAEDGVAALQTLEREPANIVLLDMHMPVMDGWEVARLLEDRRENVKLIVMTADIDAAACAAQVHADGYLAKPFDLEELLAVVTSLNAA